MGTPTSRSGKVQPVVLSGGAGTRLWPLSRELYPKQLLALVAETTLLQQTVERVRDEDAFLPPLVVCNAEHRFIVAEQLRQIGVPARDVVLEPLGRNTAPAAAVAALIVAAEDPDAVLLMLPSDHVIGDVPAFLDAAERGAVAARAGTLVTIGVSPEGPETGYGYICRAEAHTESDGCFRVARFVEKPDRETAEVFLAEGCWHWNSGVFLFTAARYLEELERLQPDILAACREAVSKGRRDLDFFRLDAEAFAASPALSIDYGVMEKTDAAAVVPAEMRWNDIGSWTALWTLGERDADGNVRIGDVVTRDVRHSYIRADGGLVAAIGLENVIIVATDDAILIAPRDRAQEVREIVDTLKAEGRSEPVSHSRVYRPWGYYQNIDVGDRFQVKQITVKPGAMLSLQKHHHRAEHWVVVNGTARVTRGDDTFLLHENESTFIPVGTVHRLENPGTEPLRLIEVQSGSYLGEDDIVRFEDTYGRD